ncbi:hypothetical protein BJ912DRAFT_979972 [Pholiota molesta]|nr:hypothetical protein BJ912DRAFT_979972 [Pholiota molesta]
MESVLAILGRLWGIIIAFVRGSHTTPSTVLPLSMKAKKSRLASWRGRNGENSDMWGVQKEEFLRHPSLRAKQGRHLGKSKTKINKSHKRHKSSILAQVTVNLHDWCTQAPPRPPRPPSGPVPSVVVTPCTPTADGFLSAVPEVIYTTPGLSPWDFAVEATQSPKHGRTDVQPERKLPSSARDKDKPGPNPPANERDITEWKVLDVRDVFAPSVESPEKSFALSDSLPSISYEHIWHNFKVRAAVTDLLRNSSFWINSGSPPNSPKGNSYVTSTPTKKPQTDNRCLATKCPVEIDTPTPYSGGTPQTLRLPDEQMDLLPYPDVFDFDMYYGVTSQRASDSIDNPSFSSLIRASLDCDKNPFGPQASSAYLSSSPSPSAPCSSPSDSDDAPNYKSAKRAGVDPETPDVSIDHEIKRYRDHYRHPAFSVSPQVSSENNTSGDSLPNDTPTPNPRAMSASLAPSQHVNKSTIQINDLPKRAFPRPGGSTMVAKKPSTKPPTVVVSHHRFETSPPESLANTDASSEALKENLRDTCNLFSKLVSTENSRSVMAL